jgi:glycosyltransferase 2 family protein
VTASTRAKVRAAATLLLTVVVLWALLRRFGGGSTFAEIVYGASAWWVGVSLLASGTCVLLGAERWRLVLAAMGYELGFRRSLEVVLATWPLAMVTPSRANDLLRPLAVRDIIPLAAGTGSVLAEKAMDLLVLLLFAAAGAAVQGLWIWAAAIGALSVAEVVVIAIVVRNRGWLERLPPLRGRRRAIEDLFMAIGALRRSPQKLLLPVLTSLGIRFLTVAISHALLVAVGAQVSLYDSITLWPAATLVGLAPLTLAGIGARDAAFIQLLAERGAHADSAQVLAATVGYSAIAIGVFAVIGLPFMVRETLRERRTPAAGPTSG